MSRNSGSPCSLYNLPWSPRQILIDDGDERISYSGNWTSYQGPDWAFWAARYNDTTHRSVLSSQGSSLAFKFNGTAVSLVGSILPASNTTSSHVQPKVSCSIDGKAIENFPSGLDLLCGVEGLENGAHEFAYSISDPTNSSSALISVNTIQFTPEVNQPVNTSDISIIDICDPAISYGGGLEDWTVFNISKNETVLQNPLTPIGYKARYRGVSTNNYGTELSYTFKGLGLEVYGIIPRAANTPAPYPANVNISYWVNRHLTDGISLNLDSNYTNVTDYGILSGAYGFFGGDVDRTVVIRYQGGPGKTPLVLSHFYAPSEVLDQMKTSHTSKGAIAGAVVGGVLGAALLFALGFLLYRRILRKRSDIVDSEYNQKTSSSLGYSFK